ncbi:DUF421 domain-containing protein [Cellulosimicrobium cellulans]|uniref:DUF421 domain-containing protein n=1 Tax=Cellulosimicrobium cellulans TaxID=1710 RepID=UPI0008484AB3|nr:YetF domain-containing protein [Cellulosimicrobium cellulans]
MWFDAWSQVMRVVVVGAAAYVWLVLVLRVSGKRTLAKLNAFDLVVTVALGSVLATILLTADVSWVEGATALATLVLLQALVSWTSTRFARGRSVVTASPSVLLCDGRLLEDALRRNRVTASEVRQAVRSNGVGGLDQVAAVVLESDGTLSVVTRSQLGDGSALADAAREGSTS